MRALGVSGLLLAGLGAAACGLTGPRAASPAAAERSFEPFRELEIGEEGVIPYLRRRTALLVCGSDELTPEQCEPWFAGRGLPTEADARRSDEPGPTAALSAAAAVSPDGYFLTSAHGIDSGPLHLALESRGAIACARARSVWSDTDRDIALVHAELRPEAWFELAPDVSLPAGEAILAYSPAVGPAAGELEIAVDLIALGDYACVALPHDAPLRRGHSGSPAALRDGRLLGVHSSTGMDTLFKRRSFLARPSPELVALRIAEDRFGGSAP